MHRNSWTPISSHHSSTNTGKVVLVSQVITCLRFVYNQG